MKVKIKKIKKDNIVKICSKYGCVFGEWKDGAPILNKEYYIEFAIKDKMILNKNLIVSNDFDYSIGIRDDLIIINGLYDSYDDNCLAIRVGDSIILLDASDELKNKFNNNDYLKVIVSKIEIYDTHTI